MKHRWIEPADKDLATGYEIESTLEKVASGAEDGWAQGAGRSPGDLPGAGQGVASLRSRVLLRKALEETGGEPPADDDHVVRWRIPSGLLVTLALVLALVTVWTAVRGSLGGSTETVTVSVPSTHAQPPGAEPDEEDPGDTPAARVSTDATALSQGGELTVHVDGAVANPGVYTLPANSRVNDAVQAAGGALPEAQTGAVNLADKLTDGVQVYLPVEGQPLSAGVAGASPGTGTSGSLVNLNTATSEQLQTLPKVGPVLAESIIAWRQEHGGFQSVEELDQVSGIGPATMDNLRPLVTV